MDQYPFGNFRDNPPWPLCLRNQAPYFSYEVQEPNIARINPPSLDPNHVHYSYLHYNAVPILVPANPFTNNFSFPPPPPSGIPSHAETGFPGRPFIPLPVSNPNEYVVLRTDAQFNASQVQKQRKLHDQRHALHQDQFVSEVKSAQYQNTKVNVSKDHDGMYNLQQKQHNDQQQFTQQTIETLSDRLQQQAKLTDQVATVEQENSATLGMTSASTGDSATGRYQTMNQQDSHVIQEEEIDFPPTQTVTTGENTVLSNLRVSQTVGTIHVTNHNEISQNLGVILTQASHQEQENTSVKQQLPHIQEEQIPSKIQDEQHAQLHQNNKKPVNSKQFQDQFNQDKVEEDLRLQNNIRRNKCERLNTEHHRTQPRLLHGEPHHRQHNNYLPPRYNHNKTQNSHQQTSRQELPQTHQPLKLYSSQKTSLQESPQDFNKPEYTPRVNTYIRYSRRGNQHIKDSETGCSREGKDKDTNDGINDHKIDFKHTGSRYYRNRRKFTSTR